MPTVQEQLQIVPCTHAPAFVARWMLHPRLGYDAARVRYEPFDRMVDADPEIDRDQDHRAEIHLPAEIEQAFADSYLSPDTDRSPASVLSKREFQVMGHLASGMTNREIAALLNISVKTIDTHRGHVLKKLKLRNNSDITRFAIQHDLIPL